MRWSSVAIVFWLAGCAVAPRTPASAPPSFSSCEAAAAYYQDMTGGPLSAPVPFKPHRIIPPNSAVTMDFNPDRLNVYTDDQGVITEARCG